MITLYVSNGVAYIWNSDDWHYLRLNHRICGSLIGSVPSFPRQNDFQGLPMVLMSEEAALLVEKEICQLIELPKLNDNLLDEQKQEIDKINDKTLAEQTEALRKRKIEQLSEKLDIIVAGKTQKMMSKGTSNVNIDKDALLQEEINKLPNLAPANTLVHLPTEHYIETERKVVLISSLKPSVLDKNGASRYAIFKDLWQKGFHITSGSKFGSDFLAYPGDPVKFHAMYMLRCINDEKTTFRPANLVAFGRLAVAVNKLAVLAFCNEFGKVEYQTLQWHDSANS
ncbi:tRNA-splicing endonuclease subunit Sen34 [Pararge aegeria]|uniref:tRNA-splicing endonuclease subunit Sen34 n=2 Tax=Pararge aegeria TaxID=116150 RepID=A0A8S4RZF9_9NEOP|nr:tRNA-splicing endonuclease subunit Sen34 [Pararge aegeria]XP_039755508.1 tRNA-splicing endonuclease subunit Sen34 [Pararge aegeria]CAH2244369.1 jg25319 [Pararge aegeria aegeria]